MTLRVIRDLSLPLSQRALVVFIFDLLVAAAAWLAAFYLRFNLSVPDDYLESAWSALAWVIPIYASVFLLSGLYRGFWRFASLPDLVRIAKSVAIGATSVAVAAYLLQPHLPVPRSVILLSPLLLVVLMGGARATYRLWREKRLVGDVPSAGKPLLILGAGRSGASLLRELQGSSEWRVVGFLDDDQEKQGREVMGHKVVGTFDDLQQIAERLHVRNAIIATPKSTAGQRQRAATLCLRAGVKGMTVPPLGDLIDGRVTLSAVRQINLEDLLGREPVWIDAANVRAMLQGRTVLVTGAGGSIGSELCRQIARYRPHRIVFLEQSEFALYRLTEEFTMAFADVPFVPLIGDVKDAARIDQVLRDTAPSIIFHAAAYKHVPLMEEHNAWQAVQNNVLGTHVVASAAVRHRVQRFVLVSTDKAVNPTSVMGATKRLAEMVCQGLQEQSDSTAMIVVRFGNVIGSAGSVIPKFQEQVAKGGPVTVTHPDVTRYFMSIPEASQLVLQAAAMAEGGQIYVLDMGRPIRIADLARDIIRLCGRSEDEVTIEYTGLRPGEKLVEQLMESSEPLLPTPHPKLQVAQARAISAAQIGAVMRELLSIETMASGETRATLARWVLDCTAEAAGADTSSAMPSRADALIAVRSS